MKILVTILLLFLVQQSLGIIVLTGKDVPKDYKIGKLMVITFEPNGKMFFRTTQNLMGIIDPKTGFLDAVFQLEKDQKIIHDEGYDKIVIAKGHDINIFSPKDQSYVKLSYSEFLEKQKFTEIISYKRLMKFDYILTDQFLVKCENPMAAYNPIQGEPQTYDKYEIIAQKEEESQQLIDIFLVVLDNKFQDVIIGLGFTKVVQNRKMLCVKKMYLHKAKVTEKCTEIDSKQKIEGILEVGPMIVVTFQTYKIVLNQKMVVLHQLKNNEIVSFREELNVVGDPTVDKNLNSDDAGNTLIFFLYGNFEAGNNLQFFERRILVKKDNSIITSIDKEEQDLPISAYGYSKDEKANTFLLIVEFENKKIKCYEINIKEKSNKVLWSFTVKDSEELKGGKMIQAKEIGVEQEEQILEDIEEEEIEKNRKNEKEEQNQISIIEDQKEIKKQETQEQNIQTQNNQPEKQFEGQKEQKDQNDIQEAELGDNEENKAKTQEVDLGEQEKKDGTGN